LSLRMSFMLLAILCFMNCSGDQDTQALPGDMASEPVAPTDAWFAFTSGAKCMDQSVNESLDLGLGGYRVSHDSYVQHYLSFMEKAKKHRRPISPKRLNSLLTEIQKERVPIFYRSITQANLRQLIIHHLRIGFLLEQMDQRELKVKITQEKVTDNYVERSLLFVDPYLGEFDGLLLFPKDGAPFPGVVAMHGHCSSAAGFRDDYYGGEFPKHGYAILLLNMGVMCGGEQEHSMTETMLLNGFTLLGLRVYETLLGIKYLKCLPFVDGKRLGVIGHSGGAGANNLTIRITPDIRACVTDFTAKYCEIEPGTGYLIDETVPDLYPYHQLINDFSTSPIPVLMENYEYVSGIEKTLAFFALHLKMQPVITAPRTIFR